MPYGRMSPDTGVAETVVIVHGIWMTSLVMRPLARHLRDCGFDTVLFNYHSLLSPLSRNAARLAHHLQILDEVLG